MFIFFFQDKGEIRRAKKGEWVKSGNGIYQVMAELTDLEFHVVDSAMAELPDGSSNFKIQYNRPDEPQPQPETGLKLVEAPEGEGRIQ